jgi:hypothetical protein
MQRNSKKNIDPSSISNQMYNEQSGAQKNLAVGPSLKPLKLSATTWTTDASTLRKIPKGVQLAVYNNAGAVGSITLSKANARTSLAPGAVDNTAGDTFGDVGIPCAPNAWTYISGLDNISVIASAATLLVFIIEDDTSVT